MSAPALISPAEGVSLSYDDLESVCASAAARWHAKSKGLAFVLARNDIATIIAMRSLQRAGHAVTLIDPATPPAILEPLVAAYEPEFIVGGDTGDHLRLLHGVSVRVQTFTSSPTAPPVHADLGTLLATSGSTGSPKFVRLSYRAVQANAESIAAALDITPAQRAVSCLPVHYSYGLSIVNSHLAAGASVVMTSESVMSAGFWGLVASESVTALAGVPYVYQLYERLGLARTVPSSVSVMTQAGGRLNNDAALRVHEFMSARGGRFHVMYGQTEATARIAIMPHEWLPGCVGGAGAVIPGGSLTCAGSTDSDGDAVAANGNDGEVVYRGENVMMGYATSRADLARGDDLGGVLRTGDLGRVDASGCLRITGRIKRMGKLFGVRVDLDDVERLLGDRGASAVVEHDDRLVCFATWGDPADLTVLRATIAGRLKVQQRNIEVRRIAEVPHTAAGKTDYQRLRSWI